MEIDRHLTNLDSGSFQYSRRHGPWMELPHADQIAESLGVPFDPLLTNCQRLIHLVYKLKFGVELPAAMWSAEIWDDETLFREVKKKEQQYPADIYLFSPFSRKTMDPKELHLAVGTGIFKKNKPLLLHANRYDGGISTWSLPEFISPVPPSPDPRYKLAGIKRLKDELWETSVKPSIYS